MMNNSRGQALVEFVLIIPVLIFILLAIFDVGNIVVSKYKLEDKLSTIVDMYENGEISKIDSFATLEKIKVEYKKHDVYITIKVSDSVTINTPGLNNILGKNMNIDAKRTIYDK